LVDGKAKDTLSCVILADAEAVKPFNLETLLKANDKGSLKSIGGLEVALRQKSKT
jgi:hypothetical protein